MVFSVIRDYHLDHTPSHQVYFGLFDFRRKFVLFSPFAVGNKLVASEGNKRLRKVSEEEQGLVSRR